MSQDISPYIIHFPPLHCHSRGPANSSLNDCSAPPTVLPTFVLATPHFQHLFPIQQPEYFFLQRLRSIMSCLCAMAPAVFSSIPYHSLQRIVWTRPSWLSKPILNTFLSGWSHWPSPNAWNMRSLFHLRTFVYALPFSWEALSLPFSCLILYSTHLSSNLSSSRSLFDLSQVFAIITFDIPSKPLCFWILSRFCGVSQQVKGDDYLTAEIVRGQRIMWALLPARDRRAYIIFKLYVQ